MSSEDNLRFQIAPRGGGPQASLSLSYNDLFKMRYNYMVIVREAIPTMFSSLLDSARTTARVSDVKWHVL
jgi:hypothetical protein